MATLTQKGRSIEERYELELTRAGLGLVEARESFPVGREERFYVEDLLGRGNMGAVYLARDRKLDRPVALKVVARRLDVEHAKRRLEQEARALARLQHPHVVSIYDLATTEHGELFLAMEYVQGETLRTWQRGRTLVDLLEAYLMAGQGLAAAHEVGCIHRDFKPDNVMVERGGGGLRVKVADFGVAGLGPDPGGATVELSPKGSGALTSPQGLVGTAAYMAPEQLRREQASARSDQHQFCVALWEALAGTRPFPDEGRDPERDAGRPSRPRAIPSSLYKVLARGMAFEPADRFEDMGALLRRLRSIRSWRLARPWVARLGALGGAVVTAVLLGPVLFPEPRDELCAEQAQSRIDEVWNPSATASVEQALSGSEGQRSYVVKELNGLASRWKNRAESACEQDRKSSTIGTRARTQCLAYQLRRFEDTVSQLESLEPKHVLGAHHLIWELKESHQQSICLIPIVLDVQDDVDDAADLKALGSLEDARVLLDGIGLPLHGTCPKKVEGETEGETNFSLEQAAISYRRGDIHAEQGDARGALEDLWDSAYQAMACNDDRRVAMALIRAAALSATDLSRSDEAERMIKLAEAAMENGGSSKEALLSYERWKARGLIAQRRASEDDERGEPDAAQRYQEALKYYEQGLQALDAIGGIDENRILAAKLIANIGTVYHEQGRYLDAEKKYRKATKLVVDELGPEHPQARDRIEHDALNQGLLILEVDWDDLARDDLNRAQEHLEIAAASKDPRLAIRALTALVQVEDQERVPALTRRIDELLRDHQGELDESTVISAMIASGQALAGIGDDRGLERLEDALSRARRSGNNSLMDLAQKVLESATEEPDPADAPDTDGDASPH